MRRGPWYRNPFKGRKGSCCNVSVRVGHKAEPITSHLRKREWLQYPGEQGPTRRSPAGCRAGKGTAARSVANPGNCDHRNGALAAEFTRKSIPLPADPGSSGDFLSRRRHTKGVGAPTETPSTKA